MKKIFAPILFVSIALALAGCSKQETAPGATSSVKAPTQTFASARQTSFGEVTSQLDAGGSVYVYLATDQWLAGLSTNISQFRNFIKSLPEVSGTDREKVDHLFDLLSSSAAKSGLENLTGVGISGVQMTPELHRTKFIAHHQAGQGDGVLWNVMGKAPHPLRGMDFLTPNTAVATFGDLDIAALWQLVESELGNCGVPEIADGVKRWPAQFEQQTKMSWPKLLASFGGEVGFVLTLDEAHKMRVPFGKQSFEMPEPGLLIAVKVNDDLLYDRISSEMEKNDNTKMTEERELKMSDMPLPLPLPVKLHLTVASSGGYLFIASSPEMVRNALAVRDGQQPGLRKSAEFEALMKYLPAEGNQFVYADRRFSATIMELQKQALHADAGAAAKLEFLQKFLLSKEPAFGLSISAHTPTGWQSVSMGNRDSAATMMAAAPVSGVAVAAAMVLPALSKAKARAQEISCRNTMKSICLAFRIWEGDNDDKFPFNVSTGKGGTLELCDSGSDGYDRNSFRHFQVMSNELNTPKILVCPQDTSKHAALNFADLQTENVSYLVRSGTNIDGLHPNEVILYCPIHNHYGYADGAVFQGRRP